MNRYNITVIAVAIGFAFSTGAMAKGMSTGEYKSGKSNIEANYKSARAGCVSFPANARNICMAEARGKENVAKAELESRYKPSPKTHYQERVARAQAEYSVARQKCDNEDGDVKDVCLKKAEAVRTARANAKAPLKTTDANGLADEKSVKARTQANKQSADARIDATADRRDVAYAVAKGKM